MQISFKHCAPSGKAFDSRAYVQAGDVRDGKAGPNTRVTMYVYDVEADTRATLEPPHHYADVYVTHTLNSVSLIIQCYTTVRVAFRLPHQSLSSRLSCSLQACIRWPASRDVIIGPINSYWTGYGRRIPPAGPLTSLRALTRYHSPIHNASTMITRL